MTRTVLVRDGRVRGYLLTDGAPTEAERAALAGDDPDPGEWVAVPPEAGLVGDDWRFDGTAWAPPPQPVPQAVTPLQARRALLAAGLLDAVTAMVAAAPPEARMAWEYATAVQRDDPTLAALAARMALSPAQVDDLFRAAAAL